MAAIDYFIEILEGPDRAEELRRDGRPVVGTLCNFVPEELVVAAGAIPVRLDAGDHEAAAEAEALIPRDACPVARSAVGLIARGKGLHALPRLVIVPTACDAKRKMGEAVTGFMPVHILALPAGKTGPGALKAWHEEVRRLSQRLEELTGQRITQRSLQAAIEGTNARQRAFRELLELRKGDPPCISGSEILLVAGASFSDDCDRFTRALQELVRERSNLTFGLAVHRPAACATSSVEPPPPLRERRGGRGVRLDMSSPSSRVLLTGAPLIYPNFRLIEIIEAAGLHVVADDLCSGTERLYHPVVPMEWNLPEMMIAVAEKALLPSTCPCFTEHGDRVSRLLGLIEEFRVDGVIYHNLRTCMLFQFETRSVKEALRKVGPRGVPMLELSTDYTAQDVEQLRTRVEAFSELLASGEVARARKSSGA